VSSVTLPIPQSKSKFPFRTVGLALLGISLLGFIYAFYPARTNVAEIDLGSELEALLSPELADNSFFKPLIQDDRQVSLVKASWTQKLKIPTPQPGATCEIGGVPRSVPEGRTLLSLTYTCNGKPLNPERLKPNWNTTAGRIELTSPSTLLIDTTGLAGQRLILSASFRGCGQNLCEKKWTITVTEPKRRIVVRVIDDAGKAVPQAVVTLNQATQKHTDANGLVQFTDLKPGNYFISIVASGFNEFTTTQQVASDRVLVRAPLVRAQTASPSPRVSPSPTPSPTPTPTLSPSPSPSASASASAEYTPSASPEPSATVAHSDTIFAPGRNGSLTVSWPNAVSRGWANVCRVRYVPPPGWSLPADYNVQAAFLLTSTTGLADREISSGFQPLDQNAHEWNLPLEPVGSDGSLVRAQLMMTVRIGSESNSRDIQLQPLQSTIEEKLLTKNQTVGGSTLSGLLGGGLLGIGGIKKKKKSDYPALPANVPSGSADESPKDDKPTSDSPRTADTSGGGPPGGLEAALTETAEPPRYADITIYEDHLFPSDDLEEATKVPDEVPLVANSLYTLEVAIRLKRTGVASDLPADREVENPRQDQETLTIHIVATPLRGFRITDRLSTIAWPYNSDSESALFQLEIDPDVDTTRPGSIEIRILDQSLNLLDIVTLEVAIVADEGTTIDPAVAPRRLVWPDKEREGLSLAGSSKPRLASIHVREVTGGFTFDFVLLSAKGKAVNISIFRDISSDDLTFLLARVRDFWSRLVITNYSKKLAVSPSTYDSYLRELRDLGIQAWSLLFDTRTYDQEGTSERVGKILSSAEDEKALKDLQPLFETSDGDRIQISYAADYGDFIFPWSILHPPAQKEAPVDPLRFWGARYQIEQVTKGPKKDRIDDRPINVLFTLDSTFGEAPSQKKMFEDYQTAAKGELIVSTPISDRKTLEEHLIRDPSMHLLYFYCHGYAATRPGLLMADGVKSLKSLIEGIREKETEGDSPTATALEKLMELTSKMAGESWIYLGDAEVKEAELRLLKFFTRRRPIVFLNMCQSADLVPSMSSGLVHLFLDHNASAVVGTESPMTGVFADAFAKMVLGRLFAGDNIGTSLWKARRHFLTEGRNPLGLAYTLYGRADATLGNKDRPFVIPTTATTFEESGTQKQ
jgi:hypothetical protein